MAHTEDAGTVEDSAPTHSNPKYPPEATQTPPELSAGEIIKKHYENKESETAPAISEHREKATELQFLWSWVAVGLILLIALLLSVVVFKWFSLERDFQTQLLVLIKDDTTSNASAQIEMYKDISQQTFDRAWRVVDGVILGGFMSLLTLIIGYVFGVQKPKAKE